MSRIAKAKWFEKICPYKNRGYSFIILLLLIPYSGFSNINVDSVKSIINYAKAVDKPDLYLKYSKELINQDNELAESYADKAIASYMKSGDKLKTADAIAVLAEIFANKGDFARSNTKYNEALVYYKGEKDKKKIASVLNSIGSNYSFAKKYREAINFYTNAMGYCRNKYPEEEGRSHFYYGLDLRDLSQPDSALQEIQKSILLFKEAGDNKNLSKAYYYVARIFQEKSLFDEAITNYMISDSLKTITGDLEGRAKTLNNIGSNYWASGKFDKAIEAFQNAIRISEQIGYLEGVASCANNIAIIYNGIGNEDKALEFHKQALKVRRQLNNRFQLAQSLANIGVLYANIAHKKLIEEYGNSDIIILQKLGPKKILEIYNDGIANCNEALRICDSLKSNKLTASLNNNLGTYYAFAGYYDKAISFYFKAIDISKNEKDLTELAKNYEALGLVYFYKGDYNLALKFLNESISIAKEYKINQTLKESYGYISELFEKLNDKGKALEYYKLFTQIKDTILNQENLKNIATLQTQYETKDKEQRIRYFEKDTALKQNQIKQQFYFIIFFILLSILVGALVILFYRQSKQRKLTNQQLEIKNELISGQKKEITDSIQYASRLQHAILPPDEVLAQHIPNHFLFFRPRDIVSGDFYYVAEKEGKIVVVAADCTGHGVPGALMSMIGTSILNEIINKHDVLKPDVILNEMRLHIIKSLHQSGKTGEQRDGMDLALYILDRKENTLEFAGANNPLLIVRNGELIEIKPDKMPIGIYEKGLTPFKATSIPVMDKDMLYTFSDGICDQFGGTEGKKFLSKRLKELLVSIHTLELAEQKEKINEAFQNWKGSHDQVDDVLVIGVRV